VIVAVVVTYNRLGKLKRCLAALAAQTVPVDVAVVIDNASTDGTAAYLRAPRDDGLRLKVIRSTRNVGGAGGFAKGMEVAYRAGADWLWLMDDDTIPQPNALDELLAADARLGGRAGFLASVPVWTDGRPHPMNAPGALFRNRREQALCYRCLPLGCLPVRNATFVSILFRRGYLRRHGLPVAEFFIWSDDVEYTLRGAGRELQVVVPASRVLHDTAALHTHRDAPPRRFYFHVRNSLWQVRINRTLNRRQKFVFALGHLLAVLPYLRRRLASPSALFEALRWIGGGIIHAVAGGRRIAALARAARGRFRQPPGGAFPR